MHIHIADQYHAGHTAVHHLDARVKVAVTLLFILVASLLPFGTFGAYGFLWLFILALIWAARLKASYVLKRAFIALPFALAAISLPFTIPGEIIWSAPLFGGIDVSLEGVIRFFSILIKSWLSVQMAIILVAVTPFPDLLWGLRALRVPQPLIAIISFMYRYLFVLSDEVLRLLRARAARSAALPGQPSGGRLLWRGKVAGRMAGSLMLRSFERSERIYQAMVARGYRGQMQILTEPALIRRDWLVLFGAVIFLALALLIGFLTR